MSLADPASAPAPPPLMQGKVVAVSGATIGIGLWTARALGRMGATVLVLGRTQAKAQAAAIWLREKTGRDAYHPYAGDMAKPEEIAAMGQAICQDHPVIDVLVNNAGVYNHKRKKNEEGLELTFAVNHLGYYRTTYHLLPSLLAAPAARIVVVSSDAHKHARLDFDRLQLEGQYSGLKAYCNSKLANLYFAYELNERLQGTGITINALHPGAVGSRFGRNFPFPLGPLFKLIAISPQKGARPSVYLASSPDVEGRSGMYFDKLNEATSSPVSYEVEPRQQLWQRSQELTGLDFNTVLKPGL